MIGDVINQPTSPRLTRAERTRLADARLRSLLAAVTAADPGRFPESTRRTCPRGVSGDEACDGTRQWLGAGIAVVALGGYGRGELSAASDLDVLLLHDERCPDIGAIAERLWYPLWDERTRLDHSVRTVSEAVEAAGSDLRSALAMLDARHVAGDASLTLRLRTTLLAAWRRQVRGRLPELAAGCRERAKRFGDLALLPEPNLKEARGGLRDGVVLRALAATCLVEVAHGALARLRSDLLDVRDVLHHVADGRPTDRLTADLQPEVAEGCGLPNRDALLRHLSHLGRTLNQILDGAWRGANSPRGSRPGPSGRFPDI